MVRGSLPRGFRPRDKKPVRGLTSMEQFLWLVLRAIELMITLLIDACENQLNTIGRGNLFYNIFIHGLRACTIGPAKWGIWFWRFTIVLFLVKASSLVIPGLWTYICDRDIFSMPLWCIGERCLYSTWEKTDVYCRCDEISWNTDIELAVWNMGRHLICYWKYGSFLETR